MNKVNEGGGGEKLEIEKMCEQFVDKYRLFMRHGLKNAKISDEKEDHIVEFFERFQAVHKELFSAFPENGVAGETVTLPFLTISEDRLSMKVIPFGPNGLVELDAAMEQMENMIRLIGIMKNLRGKFKGVYELMKFLTLQIENQMGINEKLEYDAEAAMAILRVLEFILGKTLERSDEDERLSKIFHLKRELRNTLLDKMSSDEKTKDVQKAVKSGLAGLVIDE